MLKISVGSCFPWYPIFGFATGQSARKWIGWNQNGSINANGWKKNAVFLDNISKSGSPGHRIKFRYLFIHWSNSISIHSNPWIGSIRIIFVTDQIISAMEGSISIPNRNYVCITSPLLEMFLKVAISPV